MSKVWGRWGELQGISVGSEIGGVVGKDSGVYSG